MQYRTEVEVTADRYVCLQLPDFIPAGRATVTVRADEPTSPTPGEADPEAAADGDGDAPGDRPDDFEWWEEFDGDDRGR